TTSPNQRLDVNGKIIMRSQTASSDSNNTVATKGYVDSIAGGGNTCTISGSSIWGGTQTRQHMQVWQGGCESGAQYAYQCNNGSAIRLFVTTGCGN
ncbi:hypothetical protein LAT59_03820, partial [Candidatus Gracilibacteria bacterium]|nr:hypothetical protein [Candidatus Gracilibacteria bacterium]